MFVPKMKLGNILIQEGLITIAQLDEALDVQKLKGGIPIGEVLVEMGVLEEEVLIEFLGKQFNIPYINKNKELLIPDKSFFAEEILSKEFILQHTVLPLSKKMNVLKVALLDPLDLLLMDNLRVMTGYEIQPVIVGKKLLADAINDYVSKKEQENLIESDFDHLEDHIDLDKMAAEASEGQVVRLVNLIIMQAVSDLASDIHIEPNEESFLLRYRIDGNLITVQTPPAHLYTAIVSRIKILARLDIAEKRLPQDGSITMKIEDRSIDMRVSTIPTIYGEKVCIRVLDKEKLPLDIEHLGITENIVEDFKKVLACPYGMMLVTGPTGSGKTTTLYACLNYLNKSTKNLNTIEDPVEYKLKGVNQINIKPEIGLTFASGLRSFLRQDPDIIMVGEIRDTETAEMCVKAALTGHFVLSTLHTNSAVQAIDRLINIGVESVLIVSSLLFVVAQRLLRSLCNDCKERYVPDSEVLKEYNLSKEGVYYRAKGCGLCRDLGYKGRLPIHETLMIDDDVKKLISTKASSIILEQKMKEKGMKTLRDNGLEKFKLGLTSLEEVLELTI